MSPLASGLASQLGLKEEVTWGTAVTPDRFYEIRSLSIKQEIERIESEAIRAGTRVMRSDDWLAGRKVVAGDIELELSSKNWALLGKHMFGGIVTAGAGPYTHTLTPGDLTGKGLTIQGGLPDTAGTVQPFTWAGCKVASWEMSFDNQGLVPVTLSVVGKSETTATGLATAAYTSSNALLSFTHGAITLGGSSFKVRSGSLSGDNGLNAERFYVGQDATSEPLEAALRDYSGTLECDFESLTAYNRFVNGTEAALVLTFTRSADIVQITTNVRFDGETPDVSGPDILTQTLPFKCVGSTTDASAITMVVTSSEATP